MAEESSSLLKKGADEIKSKASEGASSLVDRITSSVTVPDAKSLFEEPDATDKLLFWDKVVITLSTLITSLAAADFVTQFLGGAGSAENGNALCFVPEEFNVTDSQNDFVQNFCSQGLQRTKSFALFLPVLGFIIAVTHGVWRYSQGNAFGYFFSLANTLCQFKDPSTGEYSRENVTIVKRLTNKFTLHRSDEVLRSYRMKLIFQMFVALLGVAILAIFFAFLADFDALFHSEYDCPRPGSDPASWPYQDMTVRCITFSVQMFWLQRLVDIVLFLLIVFTLLIGFVAMTCWPHPKKFNIKQAALFSFLAGIDNDHYVARPALHYLGAVLCSCCTTSQRARPPQRRNRRVAGRHRRTQEDPETAELKTRLHEQADNESDDDQPPLNADSTENSIVYPFPRISNDLQFFLFVLFRTDESLGYAFYQAQVSIEHKALMELDQFLIDNKEIVKDFENVSTDDDKRKLVTAMATGWTITKSNKKRFVSYSERKEGENRKVEFVEKVPLPWNIRGALMSLTLRAPTNERAACVSFGTLGYSKVLTRVFQDVGSLNFDSSYENEEVPITPAGDGDLDGLLRYHIIDDVFTQPSEVYDKWHKGIQTLWEGCSFYKAIPFMVIAPITHKQYLNTAELLVGEWQRTKKFDEDAVLVLVEIDEIEGKESGFFKLTPSESYFKEMDPGLRYVPDYQPVWPLEDIDDDEDPAVELKCPQTNKDAEEYRRGKGLAIQYQCGDTVCKFRIKCYRYAGWDE